MEREIGEQPDILSAQVENYSAQARQFFKSRDFEMVLIVARGSSDHAALYARYLIEIHLGIPVSLAAPSVLTRYGSEIKYPRCLAIGISQSGAGPDIAEVISYMRNAGHRTLAITNTCGSRLSHEAEFVLHLECGEEKSVAATKTYTASLLALYEVVHALGGKLASAKEWLPTASWLASTNEAAASAFGPLNRSNPVICLARGYNFSTACETALKLMECGLIPAKSYSSADFQHGPRALAGPGSCVLTFDEKIEGLKEQGCLLIEAPSCPAPEPLAPIWNVIFGQWLALYAARGRGLNPDDPHFISKVTKTF